MSRLNHILSRAAKTGMQEHDAYQQINRLVGPFFETPNRPRPCTGPNALECPICRVASDRFLPFGLNGRPNAQCPNCGSLERHRMLWLYHWMKMSRRSSRSYRLLRSINLDCCYSKWYCPS